MDAHDAGERQCLGIHSILNFCRTPRVKKLRSTKHYIRENSRTIFIPSQIVFAFVFARHPALRRLSTHSGTVAAPGRSGTLLWTRAGGSGGGVAMERGGMRGQIRTLDGGDYRARHACACIRSLTNSFFPLI